MTSMALPAYGAPLTRPISWDSINWTAAKKHVRRLQMRIAKAIRENRFGKVKALQRLLTHSFYGKVLAIKRVTGNRGAKTPGVDGVTWKTSKQKEAGFLTLKRRGYNAQPLRRVYIAKKNGKLRPLSIPRMTCRAYQALHLSALEPISEHLADPNAYGFRPKRSAADAIEQCFNVLARRTSSQWVLEGDIRACFDTISHPWLLANVPMDKVILQKWLKAGYMERGDFHPTIKGTPQGGTISPCLLVITLSGLEQAVRQAAATSDKVNVVAYADDFIITGTSKEVLENKIRPVISAFLKERGLELSEEKTKISHIDEGFDFLGFNVRKYKGKLLIKPSKNSIKRFMDNIRETINSNKTAMTENLIRLLNPKIMGWANYFRHVVAKDTFSYVDTCIYEKLSRWIKRRHPKKNAGWRRKKYFRRDGLRNWIFHAVSKKNGKSKLLNLAYAASIPIKRHIKIRATATPYDPNLQEYLSKRKSPSNKIRKLIRDAAEIIGVHVT